MIGIFNGRTLNGTSIYAQVDVEIRENIHLFNNGNLNSFGVFMCIALHANKDGWAWPTIDTIRRETGLSTSNTIANTIRWLCNMRINGKRILARYRTRANGQWSRYLYLLFPDEASAFPQEFSDYAIEEYTPNEDYLENDEDPGINSPYTVGSYTAGSDLTITNNTKEEPLKDADSQKLSPEERKSEYLRSVEKALHKSLSKIGSDFADYPEDIRPYLIKVCDLWNLRPPNRPSLKAYWIEAGRDLQDSCGELGVLVLDSVRDDFVRYMEGHGGLPPFTVEGPGSLVKSARHCAGILRGKAKSNVTAAPVGYMVAPDGTQIPIRRT